MRTNNIKLTFLLKLTKMHAIGSNFIFIFLMTVKYVKNNNNNNNI